VPSAGWLVYPKRGKYVLHRGDLLHGAPGRGGRDISMPPCLLCAEHRERNIYICTGARTNNARALRDVSGAPAALAAAAVPEGRHRVTIVTSWEKVRTQKFTGLNLKFTGLAHNLGQLLRLLQGYSVKLRGQLVNFGSTL
jgi:hypothetical protein